MLARILKSVSLQPKQIKMYLTFCLLCWCVFDFFLLPFKALRWWLHLFLAHKLLIYYENFAAQVIIFYNSAYLMSLVCSMRRDLRWEFYGFVSFTSSALCKVLLMNINVGHRNKRVRDNYSRRLDAFGFAFVTL